MSASAAGDGIRTAIAAVCAIMVAAMHARTVSAIAATGVMIAQAAGDGKPIAIMAAHADTAASKALRAADWDQQ